MFNNTMLFGDILERVEDLIKNVENGDLQNSVHSASELLELAVIQPSITDWFTVPTNLKTLHEMIKTNFGINQRQLMLRWRVPARHKRGFLFLKAIKIAMEKKLNEMV